MAVFMLGWQDPAPAPPHASRAPPPLPAAVGRAASGRQLLQVVAHQHDAAVPVQARRHVRARSGQGV